MSSQQPPGRQSGQGRNALPDHDQHQPARPPPPLLPTSVGMVGGGLVLLGIVGIVMGLRAPGSAETPTSQIQNAPQLQASNSARPPEALRPTPVRVPPPSANSADATPLPAHVIVDESSLAPKRGHRVEARVAEMLPVTECARILDKYKDRAGKEGQVSVSVHLVAANGEETDAPLCYDNLDGKGAQEGTARQLAAAVKGKPAPLPRGK